MNSKDRNISIAEFFKILQLEYIVAELRHKIYPKNKDREYYSKLMEGKKKKVLDISERNSLLNIFDSDSLKRDYYREIFPETGFPKFRYLNQEHQFQFETLDKNNYFKVGADFKFLDIETSQVLMGKLKSISNEIATFEIDGNKIKKSEVKNISRIL